jgi:hypothetical protein
MRCRQANLARSNENNNHCKLGLEDYTSSTLGEESANANNEMDDTKGSPSRLKSNPQLENIT